MSAADGLTPALDDYVFAQTGRTYAVYLPDGGSAELDLSAANGIYDVKWYDPRHGGDLQDGSVHTVSGGGLRGLGNPPNEPANDWAVLVQRLPDAPVRFLIKLGVPVGSATSRAGDPVTAVVVSPERFLGGRLEGAVEEASADGEGVLRLTFRTLHHRDGTYRLTGTIAEFVGSKGHKLVDERGRPVQVANGALRSAMPDLEVSEGAEVEVVLHPR